MSQLSTYNLRQPRFLVEQGVKTGDPVGVISPSSIVICQLLYAALNLGVTIFPLDPQMAGERRNRLLAQAGLNLVLTDMELHGLPDGISSIRVYACDGMDEVLEQSIARSKMQLIVATSGSEGEPKGVMLSGENIAASVAASHPRLGLTSNDLWLNCLPLFHIGGIMIVFRCLDVGAGMLLHQGFDADRVWDDLKRRRVTHLSLVPAMLARLLDVSGDTAPPESLRVALIGGGHLSSELAARAHAAAWPLCVSYGMSETCSQCATDCGDQAGLITGHVGSPLDGFEIALSEQGRIKVRGPAVMQGYVNPDLSPGHGLLQDGWFETGDQGEIDKAGRLRVLGRAGDILVSGGNTIHPVEIENQIIRCPGVDEVGVSSRADKVWGDLLVALYSGTVSQYEFESWCRANLSSPMRPREFIQVSELPRNSMGKLDRKGLKGMVI